ncbi:MAG: hypothetical protein ACJ73E_17800 [Mycobacteriales bacterium]
MAVERDGEPTGPAGPTGPAELTGPAGLTGPSGGRPTSSGPGRLLVLVYGIFALSASARAGVQIATHFSAAPVAYLLSAFAALVYLVATVSLARSGPRARQVALVACTVELLGVLTVGTVSLLAPSEFPDATVWSGYGEGYGFVPLVLPVLGLLWLRHTSPRRRRAIRR